MKTSDFMKLSVVKHNFHQGYITEDEIYWMIKQIEKLQDELKRQRKHEDFLLEELKELGWFERKFKSDL